jgi:predicted DCC family thiol-disulfide oxidoreductase YuxK
MPEGPIVFFDGTCGLCNRWVNFLMQADQRQRLRFATLQGITADACLSRGADLPDSLVFWEAGILKTHSDAVLATLEALGGAWRIAGGLRIVPSRPRNVIYGWIARHRYQWFGKTNGCRVPTRDERSRFLP